MDYSFDFGGDPQDVTITLGGRVSAAGVHALSQELMEHPAFRADLLILVDLSAVDASTVTDAELEATGAVVAGRDWNFPARAIALVAADAETSAAAARYRAYVGGSRSRRELFATRDEAEAWLRTQRSSV